MSRRPAAVLGFVLVAGALSVVACSDYGESRVGTRPARTFRVDVVFQCDGLRSVNPWRLDVLPGDTVEWVLDSAQSDVAELWVEKKSWLREFPFRSRLQPGGPGKPVKGGNLKNGRGTYQYNITALCPTPDGRLEKSAIDPDIIIDVTWKR